MTATEQLYPLHQCSEVAERWVLLNDVPWSADVAFRDAVDGPGTRMTYLEGQLEIRSLSKVHEVAKKQASRLLELLCLERDIPLFGFGSMTFRREEKARGLEPDACYCRGADLHVPDVALEVVVSHGSLDKLEVYRGLGIAEVWVFESGAFRVLALREGAYHSIGASAVFPEVELARIAHFAVQADQHAALRAFRDELRAR